MIGKDDERHGELERVEGVASRPDTAGLGRGVGEAPVARRPGGIVAASKFLGRVSRLHVDDLGETIRIWRRIAGDDWFSAESMVSRAVERTGRYDEQEILLGHIADLFRRAHWFKAEEPGARVSATEASAQYVATIAMLALLVGDQIRPAELELLYRPFAGLIPIDELVRE